MTPSINKKLLCILMLVLSRYHPNGQRWFVDSYGLPSHAESGATDLLYAIQNALGDAQNGNRAKSSALADVGVDLAFTLHREVCSTQRDSRPGLLACEIDAVVATQCVVMLGAEFLDVEIDYVGLAECARAITADGLAERDIWSTAEGALATSIQDRRPPPILEAGRPRIQINTAITEVEEYAYGELRELSLAIREQLEGDSWSIEITSDYVNPKNRASRLVDEEAVRSAILHSSGMIVMAAHGRFGTAMTWTRAEDLCMPVLVLHKSEDKLAARYPGMLALRKEVVYSSLREAVEHVQEFLNINRGRILARQELLLGFQKMDISDLQRKFHDTDISVFDSTEVPMALARFHLNSPVHWFQAPLMHRDEIERKLGVQSALWPSSDSKPGKRGDPVAGRSNIEESFRSLLIYGEIEGLPYARTAHLLEVYLAEQSNQLMLSERSSPPYTFDDWQALDRRVP